MTSPYDGIEESDLLEIKAFLLKCLKGKNFSAQTVPGLSYARRIESLAEVRQELVYVQAAIDALDPDTKAPDRVFMKAV